MVPRAKTLADNLGITNILNGFPSFDQERGSALLLSRMVGSIPVGENVAYLPYVRVGILSWSCRYDSG